MNFITTSYGCTGKWLSHFIIVAPHGVDDLFTEKLSFDIAKKLDANWITNTIFMKPSNENAIKNPDLVWDFNRLPWYAEVGGFLSKITTPWLKDFIWNLMEYTRHISIHQKKRPVIVYIHGMKDRPWLGLDIGIWVRLKQTEALDSAQAYAKIFLSSENIAPGGSVISDVRNALKIRKYWQDILQNERNLFVGIGDVYFAGRPEQLPQIHQHLGYACDAIQIEVCRSLREENDYAAELIASWLQKYYY